MHRIKIVLQSLLAQVLAYLPSAFVAEHKLRKKIEELEDQESMEDDPRAKVSLEVIRGHYDKEQERRGKIEDKAKANLIAVTLAFSVIFAGLGVMTSQTTRSVFTGYLALICLVFLLLGVIYLISGGLVALKALEIGKVYDIDLTDEIRLVNEEMKIDYLLLCLELNQLTTTIRSNYTYASYKCIRNGIVSLAAFIFLAALLLFLPIQIYSCTWLQKTTGG